MKPKSLIFQLSIILIISLTLVFSFFVIFQHISDSKIKYEQLNSDLSMTADQLALSLSTAIYNINDQSVKELIFSMMKDQKVIGIFITEPWRKKNFHWYIQAKDGIITRTDKYLEGNSYLNSKRDIIYKDEKIGEIELFITKEYVQSELSTNLIRSILAILIVDIVIIFIMIFIINKIIVNPLSIINKNAMEISKGNLDIHIDIQKENEVWDLASSFNQMVVDLKKSRKELEKYSTELEKKVAERTKELQSKMEELERFNKLAVGRELKMVELKKKIKELEEKT